MCIGFEDRYRNSGLFGVFERKVNRNSPLIFAMSDEDLCRSEKDAMWMV